MRIVAKSPSECVFGLLIGIVLAATVVASCSESDEPATNAADAGDPFDGSKSGNDAHESVDAASGADVDAGAIDTDGSLAKTALPVLSPLAGNFAGSVNVTLSSDTPNATIYFSTDGTTPTSGHETYESPITIASETRIRAFAVAPGLAPSDLIDGLYSITPCPDVTKPVGFSPPAGTYAQPISIAMSTESLPSTICYTTDGSVPACNGFDCGGSTIKYTGAISFTPTTTPTTFRARACALGCPGPSEVTQATYSN